MYAATHQTHSWLLHKVSGSETIQTVNISVTKIGWLYCCSLQIQNVRVPREKLLDKIFIY